MSIDLYITNFQPQCTTNTANEVQRAKNSNTQDNAQLLNL